MAVKTSLLASTLASSEVCQQTHYEVMIPNEVNQFNLLYMPSDALYRNKYKYILSEIDVASRYKVARPMKMKQAKDIADMIADIYKVGPLPYPKTFQSRGN